MLILSRRIGEAIVINENVRVLVLSASGGTVRIGIDAPRAEIESRLVASLVAAIGAASER